MAEAMSTTTARPTNAERVATFMLGQGGDGHYCKENHHNCSLELTALLDTVAREEREACAVENCDMCQSEDWPMMDDGITHRNIHIQGQGRITAGHVSFRCKSTHLRGRAAGKVGG